MTLPDLGVQMSVDLRGKLKIADTCGRCHSRLAVCMPCFKIVRHVRLLMSRSHPKDQWCVRPEGSIELLVGEAAVCSHEVVRQRARCEARRAAALPVGTLAYVISARRRLAYAALLDTNLQVNNCRTYLSAAEAVENLRPNLVEVGVSGRYRTGNHPCLPVASVPVSYTHLTLPTKRIV